MPDIVIPDPIPERTVKCGNPDCGEYDVAKTGPVPADDDVMCGACGEVCEPS